MPVPGKLVDGQAKAIRSAQYKLIESSIDGSALLFDLTADPAEQRDLHAAQAAMADSLRAAVAPGAPAAAAAAGQPVTLNEAMRERLRALGYDQ